MSTNTGRIAWTIPLVGFANPRYFNDVITDATGFDISDADAYAVAFEGTGVSTVVHEQTLDPSGLIGWFPVFGRIVDQAGATLAQGGSLSGKAYLFAQIGVRARVRATALVTGDATMRLALLTRLGDVSASAASVTSTGGAAEDGVQFGNPVTIAMEARNTNKNPMSANGDVIRPVATMIGAQIIRPFSIPELDWSYVAAAPITTAVATTIKLAAGAGLKNYLTALQIQNEGATASVIEIKSASGGTVLWRFKVPTGWPQGISMQFPTPLQSAANALLELNVVTAGAAILFNAQGYIAP